MALLRMNYLTYDFYLPTVKALFVRISRCIFSRPSRSSAQKSKIRNVDFEKTSVSKTALLSDLVHTYNMALGASYEEFSNIFHVKSSPLEESSVSKSSTLITFLLIVVVFRSSSTIIIYQMFQFVSKITIISTDLAFLSLSSTFLVGTKSHALIYFGLASIASLSVAFAIFSIANYVGVYA